MFKVNNACVPIEYLVMGPIDNNTYIIGDEKATIVVDPCCEPERILEALGDRKLDAIICTHYHWDHVGAAGALREVTGAEVVASEIDAPYMEDPSLIPDASSTSPSATVDTRLTDGEVYTVGNMRWKTIATPGHTAGGICLFLDPQYGTDASKPPVLISGDTLFCGTIGRTDFAHGSLPDMKESLKKLAQLPDETLVLPGHNDLTTIGAERTRVFARFGA